MTTAAGPSHVYVGAAKWTGGSKSGVFRRGDGDARWELCDKGLPEDVHVQAITVHPTNPDVVYVGTQNGPYRSMDRGERWERLHFPEDGGQVWSISVHPKNARTLWGSGGLNQLAPEFSALKHERGVVSTVSIPGKPNSDGAQFFVCISPQPPLDGKFSSFGRVNEGMDVVEKIAAVPVENERPKERVDIYSMKVERRK